MEISRRSFLAVSGGVLATGCVRVFAEEQVPAAFDHMILGVNELERGIAFVEEGTGVRAAFGGVHPGRGTQNALAALGGRRYLEIMAPDPKQTKVTRRPEMVGMREPRLIGWALHVDDIAAVAAQAVEAGIGGVGPVDGSRVRPDGKTLRWKLFNLKEDRGGILPFFIEWSRDCAHPALDAPAGCELVRLAATSTQPDEVAGVCRKLGVDLIVEPGDKTQLQARIAGPKGEIELTS